MGPVLLVADPGGHLALLSWLAPQWAVNDRVWVTVASPEVGERLRGETVHLGVGPTARRPTALLRNLRHARRILKRVRPRAVLTTGAALGVPFVLAARARGVRSVFVEVVDRVDGPSLSGRLMAPWVDTVAVQRSEQRRHYPGAVVVGEIRPASAGLAARDRMGVYVSVGTHPRPMHRLVALAETLAARGHHVRLQHGASRPGRGCENVAVAAPREHRAAMQRARWLVLQGGSSALAEARALGRSPMVVPRDPRYGEHVDDHQLRYGRAHGLAVAPDEVLRRISAGWEEPATLPGPASRQAAVSVRRLVDPTPR